jgi:hypothetical protein
MRLLVATCVIAMGVCTCHAQVKAKANVNTAEAQVEDDRKWEVPEPPSPTQESARAPAPKPAAKVAPSLAPAPTTAVNAQFIGVVHDLSLSSGVPRTAVCRCLAVAYGPPSDGKFTWQGGTPTGDRDTIAIAIAADGVACPSGRPPVRVSISAVEHEGTDIVVIVEDVGEGRPIMHGAVAASPGPNGAIVLRTRHDAPYPAASGAGPCRIALK